MEKLKNRDFGDQVTGGEEDRQWTKQEASGRINKVEFKSLRKSGK